MTDWKCPRCAWVNRDFATQCLGCGLPKPESATPTKSWDLTPPDSSGMPSTANRQAALAHSGTPELAMADPLPRLAAPTINYWRTDGTNRGLLFAGAAAIISALIWYLVVVITEYELGIVAALVGWIVGTAAVIGSGKRGSLWLVGLSVLFTLMALITAEYLIAYHFTTQAFGSLELIQPPWIIIEIVIELLLASPISLLFWGFALYSAATVPFKAIAAAPAEEPSQEPSGEPLPAAPDGQVSS